MSAIVNRNKLGFRYLSLALYAFAGLGLEVLLAFLIEPLLYGIPIQEWTTAQNILHWLVTCALWMAVSAALVLWAKRKLDFNLLKAPENKMKHWQWLLVAVCLIIKVSGSYVSWGGFKVIREFYANGWLKFIFQYLYYIVETALFTLIIVFGQKAFECWFKKENIPYGGIAVAVTWGLGHILTKGSLAVGLYSVASGFIFGSVYLLVNRDIKIAFPLLFLLFVL